MLSKELNYKQGLLDTFNIYALRGYTRNNFKLNKTNTIGYFDNIDLNLCENLDLLNIPYDKVYDNTIQFSGYNLGDFLHKLFSEELPFCDAKQYKMFLKEHCLESCYKLNDPSAVPPVKTRLSDTGYDLYIVKLEKQIGLTNVYNTFVAVRPPEGYYFDVVPRSSITKMGYFQTNSVGIIDRGYTGNILIALTKLHKDIKDLELPCKIAQLIPRKLEMVTMKEITSMEETSRGLDGGIAR
jgi:dUTP pyrophosphatase